MNLAQMQMAYDYAPNGQTVLRPKQTPFYNGHNAGLVRWAQGDTRAAKGGYEPRRARPRHDSEWK